jgi:hypothetical protein
MYLYSTYLTQPPKTDVTGIIIFIILGVRSKNIVPGQQYEGRPQSRACWAMTGGSSSPACPATRIYNKIHLFV